MLDACFLLLNTITIAIAIAVINTIAAAIALAIANTVAFAAPIAVAISNTVAVAVYIAIDVAVAVYYAIIVSACKLLGYITRHSMVGAYSLDTPTPWGYFCPLLVCEQLQVGFFTL